MFHLFFMQFQKKHVVFIVFFQVFVSSRFDGSRLEHRPVDHSTWYRQQHFSAKVVFSYRRELSFYVFVSFNVAFPTFGGHVATVGWNLGRCIGWRLLQPPWYPLGWLKNAILLNVFISFF